MKKLPLKQFILFLFIIGLLFLGERTGLLSPIRGTLERITSPIAFILYQTFGRATSLASNNKRTDQSREITTLNAKVAMLEKENESLRRQLEVPVEKKRLMIAAHPIAFDRYLTIDKGADDGVKIDATVVSGDVLVGKVIKTTPHTSLVIVPTDPESQIPAWTTKLTRGEVKGEFGNTSVFGKILQGDPLEENEPVMTTGEDGYIQNIVIGTIAAIQSESRDPFKKATLELSVDARKITTVFVVLP